MATSRFIHLLAFTLVFALSVSSDSTAEFSPSPAPQHGSDDSPSVPSPSTASPPAPPPVSDLSPPPASSPSGEPSTPSKSPSAQPSAPSKSLSLAPEPVVADDGDLSANVKSEEQSESSSGGMSGGTKAGIAIGVIAAACVVGFGGMLYKKRQENIRRAQFSSAARREFL